MKKLELNGLYVNNNNIKLTLRNINDNTRLYYKTIL